MILQELKEECFSLKDSDGEFEYNELLELDTVLKILEDNNIKVK